jgi:diacylglycerol kinase
LLFINMLFWIRFLVEYLVRFIGNAPEPLYIVLFALLFLDMAAYGILAFGLWRKWKLPNVLLIPFLALNAVLSVTDQMGLWDVAALLMNAGTCAVYLLERRAGKGGAGRDAGKENKNFLSSFMYAARGIGVCARGERNFRIELVIAAAVLIACVLLKVSVAEAACAILCCAAVLGAGAVLVAAVGAAAVGICIFLPRLLAVLLT